MSTTPEIPLKVPETPPLPETQSEIPEAMEQGQPMVTQQAQAVTRPITTATTTTQQSTAVPSVTIPADPAQLTILAKGSPVNALTWFALFWLRMIKKALGLGASIMTSQSIKIPAPEATQDNSGPQNLTNITTTPVPTSNESKTNSFNSETTNN